MSTYIITNNNERCSMIYLITIQFLLLKCSTVKFKIYTMRK